MRLITTEFDARASGTGAPVFHDKGESVEFLPPVPAVPAQLIGTPPPRSSADRISLDLPVRVRRSAPPERRAVVLR
jgi:hypothetical protein